MEIVKNELEKIRIIDQYCATNGRPPDKFKDYPIEKWNNFKDSVYQKNQQKIEAYLDKYGYLGFNEIGEHSSNILRLVAQHSDKNINFQKRILTELKVQVDKKNAKASNYAYLYDRVKINSNQMQYYATQVEYNKLGQAIPKKLEDSINIDARRIEYSLMPLKKYLNLLTKNHFEMNKDYFLKRGITEPKLYK
ncbi:hypothetical protein OIU83_22590 [Flavobacterium sp. LS1R49]|uniref:Uncharacterized protein n=1 Tax=Flavobacterium shii TaxID=2987687 RepID=A0A9X2ZFK7_9FLAO|nr:DUF6624 domain-containing protein [Flavobacterium shii]MCV9930466.1 hypothetical protein [Flavobacterium shii]